MMKKIFSLVLCLCLLSAAFSALAATKTVYDFEDFTLEADTEPEIGTKNSSSVLFQYKPFASSGDNATNANATWIGSGISSSMTPAEMTESVRALEADLRNGYASYNMSLDAYVVQDAIQTEYWGFPALQCDLESTLSSGGVSVSMVQRQIIVFAAPGAYAFTVSSGDMEKLDAATADLVASLTWK